MPGRYNLGMSESIGPVVTADDIPNLAAHLGKWWSKYGERFHVVGPCLSGDYYAWLKAEPNGARIFGDDLADLVANLHAAWVSKRLFRSVNNTGLSRAWDQFLAT